MVPLAVPRGARKPAPAKPQPQTASKDKPPAGKPAAATAKEAAIRTLAEEQRVYLERLQAISKIRQIANDQRDEELLKRADDLEAQAEEVFKQRTALLPAAGDGRDDRCCSSAAGTTGRRRPSGRARGAARRGGTTNEDARRDHADRGRCRRGRVRDHREELGGRRAAADLQGRPVHDHGGPGQAAGGRRAFRRTTSTTTTSATRSASSRPS